MIGDVIKANKSGFHGSRKGVLHDRILIWVSLEHLEIKKWISIAKKWFHRHESQTRKPNNVKTAIVKRF